MASRAVGRWTFALLLSFVCLFYLSTNNSSWLSNLAWLQHSAALHHIPASSSIDASPFFLNAVKDHHPTHTPTLTPFPPSSPSPAPPSPPPSGFQYPSVSPVSSLPPRCPPERQRRADRVLVGELPSSYVSYPIVSLQSPEPTCWTRELFEQWKAGSLQGFALDPVTAALTSHMRFSVVTGSALHRQRDDVIMCTYGQQLKYGQLWFHSDVAEDSQQRLPIMGSLISAPGTTCDHWCSQRKWIVGLNETFHQGLQDPDVHWFMVADDDTFIAPRNLALLTTLYNHSLPILIGQVHYEVEDKPHNHALYGGAGYLVSRQLALNILPLWHRCDQYYTGWSDLMIPRCLIELGGAQLVDRLEMASNTPKYYMTQEDDCVEWIRPGLSRVATFHYVKPWQEYYQLFMLYRAFAG